MALTPEQSTQFRDGAEELFRRVATRYRGNNVAVSVTVAYSAAMLTLNGAEMNAQQTREFVFGVNEKLARNPRFASMTPLEKPSANVSLKWIANSSRPLDTIPLNRAGQGPLQVRASDSYGRKYAHSIRNVRALIRFRMTQRIGRDRAYRASAPRVGLLRVR